MPSHRKARRCLLCASMLASLGANWPANAATKTWAGGNGLWSSAGNWNPSGVPVAGDVVFLNQGGGVTSTYTSAVPVATLGLVEVSNSMTMLQTSGTYQNNNFVLSNGTFTLNGGAVSISNITVGSAAFSTGIINVLSGSLAVTNVFLGSPLGGGTVNVSGGLLSAPFITLAPNGSNAIGCTLNLTSGSVALGAGGTMLINTGGRFDFNGGSLSGGTVTMSGGSANFGTSNFGGSSLTRWSQSAGSINCTSSFVVFANTHSMSGGTLNTGNNPLGVQNSKIFDHSGGAVETGQFTIAQTGAGTYLLSGNGVVNASTGFIGGSNAGVTGTVLQSGGTIAFSATATVGGGFGNGSYSLSGGTLLANRNDPSAPSLDIEGFSGGTATFDQTGGRVITPGWVQIGGFGDGIYQMSGVGSLTAGSLNIGARNGGATGSALFSMSNGSATITNQIIIGATPSTPGGRFTMTGGQLSAGSIDIRSLGTFTHSGGTVTSSTSVFLNGGTITTFTNRGSLTVNSGTLGTLVNIGTTTINGVATMSVGTNSSTSPALFNVAGGTLNITGTMFNEATMSVTGGTTRQPSGVLFDGNNNPGTILLSAGTVDATVEVGQASAGAGTVQQSGGVMTGPQLFISSKGFYDLSGGVISSGSITVNGTLNLNGGSISSATINLNGTLGGNGLTLVFGTLNQTGGTIAGSFNNFGTYNFSSGSVPGTIINNGLINVSSSFLVGGIINYASISIGAGQSLGGTTVGIDNFGALTLSGGILNGNTVINDAGGIMNARGTITAAFTNAGQLDTTGLLTLSAASSNIGVINIGAPESIRPVLGLSNAGQINLAGGAITTGSITNNAGGVIRGFGTVGSNFPANSGIVQADSASPLVVSLLAANTSSGEIQVFDGSTMTLFASLANNGVITLEGDHSSLGGGTIGNAGTIRGRGVISNPINNTGIITAEGNLDLTGITVNFPGAIIDIPDSTRLRVTQGLGTNTGSIFLGGGTLDNTLISLTNSGVIEGHGAIRAASLINNATIALSGSSSDIFPQLLNTLGAKTIVTGLGTTTFYGTVTNNAGSELRVSSGATAIFLGNLFGLSFVTGGGTKIIEGSASGGPLATSGNTIVDPGASLTASSITENSLTVSGVATILPNGTNSGTSRLNLLSIPGGKFDLADNDLIATATPISTIAGFITAAFDGGNWLGNGLVSSSAASVAADSGNTHKTGLGYAIASSINASVFDGQPVGGDNVLVRYTFSGDANLDGVVNALDFNALASNFGGSGKPWVQGDFNYDGVINSLDFNSIATNFNLALPAPPALGNLVPEPALAGFGLLALIRRQRRSHQRNRR